MYSWIWQKLPLPGWLKFIIFLLIFLGIVAFLFLYGFPYIANFLPFPYGNAGSGSM
jgi:hypothetical protein